MEAADRGALIRRGYRALRARAKAAYLSAKALLVRRFRSYDPPALRAALRRLGLTEGDTLLVHAGFTPFTGFTGSPQALLDCLHAALGREGHLLMVSMAYTGSAYEYLGGGEPFDVRRTMSRMGLVTEVFRRRPGVQRSLNPVHPVLAQGPRAEWLVAGHDATPFSCGEGTPFEKLVALKGKILLYDVSFITATFLHHLEHRFRDRLPVRVYHDEQLQAKVVDQDGVERPFTTRVFDPATAQRRDRVWLDLEDEFRRRGAVRGARIGNTSLILIDAPRLVECADALLPALGVDPTREASGPS